MSFPWHDPQFWLATAVFLAAAWWLLRGVLPRAVGGKGGGKGRGGRGRKVGLTVEGRAVQGQGKKRG